MTDHTPTPRTAQIMVCVREAIDTDKREVAYAHRDAAENEITKMERELAEAKSSLEQGCSIILRQRDEINEATRALANGTFLDEEARVCLKGYLLAHEVDIAMDINDYGDLAPPFEALFGRKPGATK